MIPARIRSAALVYAEMLARQSHTGVQPSWPDEIEEGFDLIANDTLRKTETFDGRTFAARVNQQLLALAFLATEPEKPRMRRWVGWWECEGKDLHGATVVTLGDTPREAYEDWYRAAYKWYA